MAIFCKAHSIRARLDDRINYAITADKTKSLVDKIEYATDANKTEQAMFSSVINCDSVETAFREMLDVKEQYHKKDGVLGYTFIQSFSPDDNLTPEQAHEIGVRLAQEFFGDRFQVVVGTHLDKAHLHNHFVINSVSFVDGKKYLNKLHYLNDLRAINDRLCTEYGLSIVAPKSKSSMESYADWKFRKDGFIPRNDIIRNDIDECIRQSLSFVEFVARMKSLGYIIRYGSNVKYMTVLTPGAERARRVHKLGENYTEDAIRHRIEINTPEIAREAVRCTHGTKQESRNVPKAVRAYRAGKPYSRKKLTGLQARYYRILYTLGMIHKRPQANRSMYFSMYDQVRQLDGYIRQMKFLSTNNVHSLEVLFQVKLSLQSQIDFLLKERSALYRQNGKDSHKEQIGQLTERLKELRRALRDCESIETRSVESDQRIRHAQEQEDERQKREQQERLRGRSR
ncbi:MAG TPA: relaxase/mobilization nuclease domain-containing protein [Clostridia bacterium]|nr:relaxase/mobilization nuclease domain-containing protein [Clostridia bacterium]